MEFEPGTCRAIGTGFTGEKKKVGSHLPWVDHRANQDTE